MLDPKSRDPSGKPARGAGARLLLATLAVLTPGTVGAGQLSEKAETAFCRPDDRPSCTCSFPTIETVLTFGEAAELVLLYFHEFPDDRYITLLERLLRECGAASLDAIPRRPNSGAAAHQSRRPVLIQNAPGMSGGQP